MVEAVIEMEEREFSFSDADFRFLSQLVGKRTGIVLAEHKKDMVYSRLARRLRALDLGDFAAYCNLVQSDDGAEEIGNLINAITTNLTHFFRERHHFDHLRDHVLAPLAAHPPAQKHIRIWSAACSSGMEAYSIAMTIRAAVPNLASWDARILATDIDTNMIRAGMAGTYPADQYKNIPEAYRKQVTLDEKDGTMQMADALKEMIAFKSLNLLENWPMRRQFDAVFCRNVVIYFDKPTQEVLFNRIAGLLKPEGWLYVGHSENLTKITTRFELVGRTIYRKAA